MKVFDVVLNGDLTVTSDLDIFEKVGRGVAHDEYVEFSVENNKIIYQGEESEISAGKIRVEFIKSYRDNPKINAVIMIKGSMNDWPRLPPLPVEQEEDELADELKVDYNKLENITKLITIYFSGIHNSSEEAKRTSGGGSICGG